MQRIGSKTQVWHGTADHTSGGLKRTDLVKSKSGKVVSKKKQAAGKRAFAKNNLKPRTKDELANIRPNKPKNLNASRQTLKFS